MSSTDFNTPIAVELAKSFGAPVEVSHMQENPDPDAYPRVIEVVQEKTVDEMAASDAEVTFVAPNGVTMLRPLTYIEILDRLVELGYTITKEKDN